MAEYIERATAVKSVLRMRRAENSVAQNRMLSIIQMDMLKLPTVDAEVVVRCKDCEYSYDEISYLCCSHGVCVDCEVPPNFYCAYGKRRAEKEPPEEGET